MTRDPWQRLSFWVAALLWALTLPLYAVKVYFKSDYTDFLVYYRAASRMKAQTWEQIYTLADGTCPFRYAPATLPLFRPLAELTQTQGRMIWYFLQYGWFSLGFLLLYFSLKTALKKSKNEKIALGVLSLTVLFTLRFCLDCFTIGQVSSLLFLGFSGGLLGWILGRFAWSGSFLFFPTLFKIGPGFLYGIFLSARPRHRHRAWSAPLIWTLILLLMVSLLAFDMNGQLLIHLWKKWAFIVQSDSDYYDASHYGSQSLKSALLRCVKWGWFNLFWANLLYISSVLCGCIGITLYWLTRRANSFLGRGLFYSLGVFAYLWFMPETFKYSFTVLALPIAYLLAAEFSQKKASLFTRFALGFFFFFVSLAGKDLLPDFLFFGLQKLSVPLLATVFLAIATLLQAQKHSTCSRLGRIMADYLFFPALGPWPQLPVMSVGASKKYEISAWVPLFMDPSSLLEPERLKVFFLELSDFLKNKYPQQMRPLPFEILAIPYGKQVSQFHPLYQVLLELQKQIPELRILADSSNTLQSPGEGRGAALRGAYLAHQGANIWVFNAEHSAVLSFYGEAQEKLAQGFDLVRGNRRHPATRFQVPVRVLHLVFGRHRLGLLFNRLVHQILPIKCPDTHSGIFVLSQRLADRLFALQTTGGFLFDLEVSLINQQAGWKELDLPLGLRLLDEKKITRMLHETLSLFFGLIRVRRRLLRGDYRLEKKLPPLVFTADDWGISPAVNEAITGLAQQGLLNRTSAMAYSDHLQAGLTQALQIPGLQFGMHFDLTFNKTSPFKILLQWLNPFSDRNELREQVRAEFRKQLSLLKAAGIRPLHLDGHHHVHAVPGIFDAIKDLLEKEGIHQVRLPYDPALWWSVKFPLALMSLHLKRRLQDHGFKVLPFFYPGLKHFAEPSLLRRTLMKKSGAEVIVHPATAGDFKRFGIPDSYSKERVLEYQALRMLRWNDVHHHSPVRDPLNCL